MKIVNIVEEPLKDLVQLLRDNGFNTTSSCGHLPNPYIQMEWYSDSAITKLYNLLIENSYKNFLIKAVWNITFGVNDKTLEVVFSFKQKLAMLEDIKNENNVVER